MTQVPVVSCVMPTTAARRRFIPQAIRYYRRQTYAHRELIILSDGESRIEDLIPNEADIRHVHVEQPFEMLGAKRNYINNLTSGDYIMHWDDDDWHAPWRVQAQIEAIEGRTDVVCGLRNLYWMEPITNRWWYYTWPEGIPGCQGNTLLYSQEFWHAGEPIPIDVPRGSDNTWLARRRAKVIVPDDDYLVVGVVHADNLSPKVSNDQVWAEVTPLDLGPDREFYEETQP